MPAALPLFDPCPRGLEEALVEELRALGATPVATAGGVSFAGDSGLMMAVNLHSRLASRVHLQVARGRFSHPDHIYALARDVDWAGFFAPDLSFKMYVTPVRCEVGSPIFLMQRAKDGICDRFRQDRGQRPNVDTHTPDMRVHLLLVDDQATLYLDTSGEALFKRGYRQQSSEAPIRENLAAGILVLLGWQPGEALLDPMCGSGTFLLEAGLMARRIAPGSRRRFAFERFRRHDTPAWARLLREARGRETRERVPLFGADISSEGLAHARANLRVTGLDDTVELRQVDCLEGEPPASTGLWVANPPYGVRLGEIEALAAFYPRWGDVLKQRFSGWRASFITADPELPRRIGLKTRRRTPLFNGALECRLLEYVMVAGRPGGSGTA